MAERTEKIQELRRQAMALPLLPGVYIMKDAKNKIIYIGKAKALKNRVSQYFGSDTNHPEKVRQMVAHVDHFDYIVADSEFEALVLDRMPVRLSAFQRKADSRRQHRPEVR